MHKQKNPYKRLPGNGSKAVIPAPWIYLLALMFPIVLLLRHRVRLFQSADHILSVTSTGYSETYKRFYYQDIQAITMRRTPDDLAWNAVWVTLIVIFISLAAFSDAEIRGLFSIVAGIFGLCLLTNLILGPTCVCQIKSAVQTEPLLALNRVRSGRKAIQRIQEQIAVYQKIQTSTPAEPAITPTGIG